MPADLRRRNPRCYTLIELIMVIIILGLAAAILIPSLSNRDRLAVHAAVRLIIGDLSFAASDAQANQEYRRVYFFQNRPGYCIMRVQNPPNFATPMDVESCPACPLTDLILDRFKGNRPYVVEFDKISRLEGISVSDVSIDVMGGREITYDSLGGTVYDDGVVGIVPGMGGYIQLSFDDQVYRVNISPFTGKMTVQECPPPMGCP